ncbi:hypothetical protein BBP40_010383 [Aspergillus hancockii]|nr:hypothetical protein BBP40_010383 [Aspergillus hancockii]
MSTNSNLSLVVRVPDGQSPKLVKESLPLPSPGRGQVLVKTSHIAQNPTDVQSLDSNAFGDGAVLGCDFVGVVIEVGKGVTRLAKGDVVAALIWGGETNGLGAYSEYCLASEFPSSPRNILLVRSYGAKHVFDYKYEEVAENIRKTAPNIHHVFDTVGGPNSSPTASRVFGNHEGNVCTVRPGKADTEGVTENTHTTDVLVWTSFLKDHRYGNFHWPPVSCLRNWARGSWLEKGTIKPNTTKVLQGLAAVPDGFQEYRDGKISAYKNVYQI